MGCTHAATYLAEGACAAEYRLHAIETVFGVYENLLFSGQAGFNRSIPEISPIVM
jgi:hypothetical protein